MREIGHIPAPDRLAASLRSYSRAAQEKGEALFNSGAVRSVWAVRPGAEFAAEIEGDMQEAVILAYDSRKGSWQGDCGCALGQGCQHVFAAAKALLAEHSLAMVNSLAAGTRTGNPLPPTGSELARALEAKCGRPLTAQEITYIRAVHRLFTRCRQTSVIGLTEADLLELGFRLQLRSGDRFQPWEELPHSEVLFWSFIAQGAASAKNPIPPFMHPVTELAEVNRCLEETRRRRFIEYWRDCLGEYHAPPVEESIPGGELDFRVVLGKTSALLEWKPAGNAEFETPKPAFLRQMLLASAPALSHLSPEAETIWQAFAGKVANHLGSAELSYGLEDEKAALGRLLSRPALASRILGLERLPLKRVSEPLHWDLMEPADGQPDIRLRLLQTDGNPVPKFLFNVGRNPVLYVSGDSVFRGPPEPHFLSNRAGTSLPAAAIESEPGIHFLEQLGVALPAKLQARLERVPVQVTIRCRLQTIEDTGGPEVCILKPSALSADDRIRWQWMLHAWNRVGGRSTEPAGEGDERIRLYDESLLRAVQTAIQTLGVRTGLNVPGIYLRVTKTFPETFTAWLRSLPSGVEVELEGELQSLLQDAVAGRIRLDLTEADIDWFDLRVVLDVSDTSLTPQEIKLLLDAKGAFVRLKDRGWRRMQFDLTPEDDEQLARLGLTARELSSEPQRMHALQLADPAARRFMTPVQAEKVERRSSEIRIRVTPEVPSGIRAELRPYQREGFHFLAYLAENRFGGILADDMGLGKTVQTLTWLAWLRDRWQETEKQPIPAALVVCPKSVMDNWRAEAAKFAPDLRVKLWHGSQMNSLADQLGDAELHVLNYTQLRMIGEDLASVQWLAAILDEGQYIKNANSQTAQAARVLRARHRLVLSGTPIENQLLDLWSLLAFAMPGMLSSRYHFGRVYGAKEDPFARRRLAARVRPFLLRRTKSQVAKDLPDRVEEDLYCEMEGDQLTLYRAELKRAQQLLLAIQTQKELAQQQFNFLTALLRLRQICCHPRLYKPDLRSDGAKVEAALDQLGPIMEEGHKVLVFSQFVGLLDFLKPLLQARRWPLFYLTGATEDRGELVRQFQETEGPAIFLISLKAGGFGLNLTAASYVILFDPWWNPAVENQAIDRTHRIGQKNQVIAYRLLIKNSIEEKIRQLQRNKSALAEDVLGEEKFAQRLTLDDLRYLLAD